MPLKPTVLERLSIRSKTDGDCLVWTGGTIPDGYGIMWISGRNQLVHRVAWVERHGPIPDETPHVLHTCDNPSCFADEHLFLGTHADNMRDMIAKGRGNKRKPSHCPQDHPYDEANTYVDPKGHRHCRICKRAAHERWVLRHV